MLSGESVDDVIGDGYGVLATVAGESCSLLVASCVLAASVIIWEACAFAALAAVLVAGVTWCLSVVAVVLPARRFPPLAPGRPSRRRDGAEPARVPAPVPRRLHRRVAADARHVPAVQV